MCRIDNNILIWATTHYFCDTEEKDTASRINGLPFSPQHRTINYSCLVKPTKHKEGSQDCETNSKVVPREELRAPVQRLTLP